MGKSKEIKQNGTETENFEICFSVIFDRYYESFISFVIIVINIIIIIIIIISINLF